MKDMTTGSPVRLIIRFMIPVLLGNLLQLTYTIADTRIIGTFLGDEALAAVGATTILFNLLSNFFMGLANGFAIHTSMAFGAKDEQKVRTSFATALMMGILLSVLMVFVTLLGIHFIMDVLNVPTALRPVSLSYIRIVIAGLLITMLYDILLCSARAIGDSFTPLMILVLSVGTNIAGDLLLMGYFHTGVWGAAAATVGAQAISLVVCALYLLKKYEFFRLKKADFQSMNKILTSNMLATGFSMALMSSLINIGSFVLQTAINELGNSYIVAQTAARRVTEIMMAIFVATGQTLATYSSQNFGARRYDRIWKGMNAGYIITCSWCIAVLILVYLFAPDLIVMITGSSDQVMIDAANRYLRIDSILYVLVAVIFVQRNSLQGMGDRITPLISSGIEMAGKVIFTYTLVKNFGYNGVIAVEPIVWVIMIIPLIWKVHRMKVQLKAESAKNFL